jgi:hypothetical protein
MPVVDQSCESPGVNDTLGFADRCTCPVDHVLETPGTYDCIPITSCPALSPSPPPPQTPPPVPPLPPLQPLLAPPSNLPVCTDAQIALNGEFCDGGFWNPSVCEMDAGAHCAERCGKCRVDYPDISVSPTVLVEFTVATPLHLFQPTPFAAKLAEVAEVAQPQVSLKLQRGSTVVDATIVAADGSVDGATAIAARVNAAVPNAQLASQIFSVPVASFTAASVVVSPPPPSPPPPSPPTTPPPAGAATVPMLAVVVAAVVGVLLLVGVGVVVFCMLPSKDRTDKDRRKRGGLYAPLVVVNQPSETATIVRL